jgi:hypothetical protein
MTQGVLRLPPELWTDSPVDKEQRYDRYVEAANKLLLLDAIEENGWTLSSPPNMKGSGKFLKVRMKSGSVDSR